MIGIAVITVIMLSNFLFQLTDLIIVKDIPVSLVLELLFYQLPEIIVQTFPIAVLFATMTGMGRLKRENEFTALRMGGISLYRLILPLVITGIIISGVTYLLNEEVVPWSNHRAKNIIRRTILKEAMPSVRENVFFEGPQGRLFYVDNYNEDSSVLKNIVIYNFPQQGKFPEIITAARGEIEENKWYLKEGIIHKYDESGHLTLETQFKNMEIELAGDTDRFFGEQRTPSEMSREELKRQIDLFKNSGISVHSLLVDYHLKIAMPLAALIFILIGTPLSLTGPDNRGLNIVLTIIIIFLYYLIQSVSRSFGRNGFLPPLLAAWAPNLIFVVIGLILLIWRESWSNFMQKVIPGFLTIILVLMIFLPAVTAESRVNVKGDHLTYDKNTGLLTVSGSIQGQYLNYYFYADEVIVYMEDGEEEILRTPEKINMEPGDFSGCDFEQPHYFFRADNINIYPGDYLEAYNVVFWEAGGKLPLFYWPYLYIDLKRKDQRFIPEFGYHSQRGWFIKTTYYYSIQNRLPSEFYLDYYTISGGAAGIKQYFIHSPREKGYVYLYGQQNRTDIRGLFSWEGEVFYQNKELDWSPEAALKFISYQDYDILTGDLGFFKEMEDQAVNFNSTYRKQDYHQSLEDDNTDLEIDLDYEKSFPDILDMDVNFIKAIEIKGRDLVVSDTDERNLNLHYHQIDNMDLEVVYEYEKTREVDEEIEINDYKELGFDYDWETGWNLNLNFSREELMESEKPMQSRWEGESSLSKRINDLKLELFLGRSDPHFDEDEDQVSFYRWPEFNIYYGPSGNFDYRLHLGRYYEDETGLEGYRGRGDIEYNNRWQLPLNSLLQTKQVISGFIYLPQKESYILSEDNSSYPYQLSYYNRVQVSNNIGSHLTLNNTYQGRLNLGYSPFNFDQQETEEQLTSELRYSREKVDFNIKGGYDFYESEYYPLTASLKVNPAANWSLELGTTYDLNKQEFEKDLALVNKYEGQSFQTRTAVKYDLNENNLYLLENRLTYNIPGDYGWSLENVISYDHENDEGERIEEASIILKKKLHCRQLWFSYDYKREEFLVSYHLNLFPDQGIKIGTSEERDFIFETGIEEILKEELD